MSGPKIPSGSTMTDYDRARFFREKIDEEFESIFDAARTDFAEQLRRVNDLNNIDWIKNFFEGTDEQMDVEIYCLSDPEIDSYCYIHSDEYCEPKCPVTITGLSMSDLLVSPYLHPLLLYPYYCECDE